MRKKPRTKKRTTTRRKKSRMGAASSIDFQSLLGVAAGAIGAKMLDKVIPTTLDPKIVNGGKIALGIFLPMAFKDGKMKSIASGVGMGMVAVGTIDLFKDLNILSGLNDNDMVEVQLSGVETVLAGLDPRLDVINGIDDRLDVINGERFDRTVLAGDNEDLSIINGYSED